MRVLFVEGEDREALVVLAEALPHPYWLLEGEGVFLLQVLGAGEEARARAEAVPGVRVWPARSTPVLFDDDGSPAATP